MSRGLRLAEQGFEQAFARITAAKSEDDALIALHETLGWLYSLEEYHRHRLGDCYFPKRDAKPQGEVVAGMVWARGFAVHELAVTSDLGDLFPDAFTETFGVLEWRKEVQLPTKRAPDKHRRDIHYRTHLGGKPVPDTLLLAWEFFLDIIPKV